MGKSTQARQVYAKVITLKYAIDAALYLDLQGGFYGTSRFPGKCELFFGLDGHAICLANGVLSKLLRLCDLADTPRLSEAATFFAHHCQFWLWAKLIRG